MEREVLTFPSGEIFSVWDARFSDVRLERRPHKKHYPDGAIRDGTGLVELARVHFRTSPAALEAGQRGQLSASDDRFYHITISAVERSGDFLLVSGEAERHIRPKREN